MAHVPIQDLQSGENDNQIKHEEQNMRSTGLQKKHKDTEKKGRWLNQHTCRESQRHLLTLASSGWGKKEGVLNSKYKYKCRAEWVTLLLWRWAVLWGSNVKHQRCRHENMKDQHLISRISYLTVYFYIKVFSKKKKKKKEKKLQQFCKQSTITCS